MAVPPVTPAPAQPAPVNQPDQASWNKAVMQGAEMLFVELGMDAISNASSEESESAS